jgi:ATP-binding cassette subfamily F protein 3
MLTAHGLSKRFADRPLFEEVSFSLNRADRVGLIGPNGSGKSTLIRILAGLEAPDAGTVTRSPAGLRLGYLPQTFDAPPETTIEEVLPSRGREIDRIEAELAALEAGLAEGGQAPAAADAYDRALQALADLRADAGSASPLESLGLASLTTSTRIGELSGGQKRRLALAMVLAGRPQALLLDEPTNHLDIAMLEWLEKWLAGFEGAALLVSHDRVFLDRSVNRVLDLSPETHRVRSYTGNYSAYLEQWTAERGRQWSAYRDQRAEIRRMRQDIAHVKSQAQRVEQGTINDQLRRYAKKVARKAQAREKKLERYLTSDERVEKPALSWQMSVAFAPASHLGRDVLVAEALAVGYPGHAPILHGLELRVRQGDRITLTGPNGSGKTTLLRTIAGELAPQAGRVRLGTSVRLGFMPQEQERLDPRSCALEALLAVAPMGETQARTFLHRFLFHGDDSLRLSADLSSGERARLTLALLVAAGSTFLLLDEPINHLDIPSRARFEQALAGYEGTVLGVVHDRYFIERFATEVWEVRGMGIVRA